MQAVLRRAGLEERLRQERAVTLWNRVAGPNLAARSRALEVREGTLWVGVENAAWAAQLSFLRSDLLRRLQAEGATVAAIQFRLARLERGVRDDGVPEIAQPLPPPRPGEMRLAERLAAPLPDLRLAEAWRALVVAGLRRSRGHAETVTERALPAGAPGRGEE